MNNGGSIRNPALLLIAATIFAFSANAQTVAVLSPVSTETSEAVAAKLEAELEDNFDLIDRDLARSGFEAQEFDNPFNLSDSEVRIVGAGIESKFLLLIRADTLRRTTLDRKVYYESYCAFYLVDSRQGDLVHWHLISSTSDIEALAMTEISSKISGAALKITEEIRKYETNQVPKIPEIRSPDHEFDKSSRTPLPYKRIKPEYTKSADSYGIEATVDILVEIDRTGAVTSTRIVRWAGFGLDESVEKTVRAMIWRPADNKSGPFTTQVLLRYNFRDIDNKSDKL